MSPVTRTLDTGLLVLAAGVALASALPLFARLWWIFDLFSHFRLQYLVLLGLLTVILLRRGYRLWSLGMLPFAILSVIPLLGNASTNKTSAVTGNSFSIMSINVNADNPEHLRLLALVENENPDLVLLVEWTEAWRQGTESLTERYPHQIVVAQDDRFGIALLSRIPFSSSTVLDLSKTPVILAQLELAGAEISVLGVHLRPPVSGQWAADRNLQLQQLSSLIGTIDGAVAIVGDFNVTQYSPIFSTWLRDNRLQSGAGRQQFSISWPTFLPLLGILIDHCVVSDEIDINEFRIGPAFGSDHYPFTATLSPRGVQ